MASELEIIREIIKAHHKIRERVLQVGESVNDFEALFSLQSAQSGLAQGSLEGQSEKIEKLQVMIASLEKGLEVHFGYEEKYLPPLFGQLLMRALIFEHKESFEALDRAKSAMKAAGKNGLSQADLLSKKSRVLQAIGGVCTYFEEHAAREEVILNMIRRVLEAQGAK